ncbi:MAG TPA: iron dicitrate transport regulator FecR [Giesbergeria sp.]|nr:iron dicitrate transport regulator FecR [Giesbergeria sp.]
MELRGDVRRNGQALTAQGSVAAGDRIETGPGASAVFTVGDSAYLVRESTRLELQGETPLTVRVLRLLSGAVASVWSKGADRQLVTPTLTAGIRGTGVYAEVRPQEDYRSYFCNCYGSVDLNAGGEQLRSESEYHQSFWAEAHPREGRRLIPAEAINHTDEEMEMLAALVQQRTAWQITGRKGSRDGSGKQSPYGGYRTPQTRTPPAPQPAPEPHYSPN